MFNSKTTAAVGGAVLGLFLAAASMNAASSVARTTHLRFSGAVGLPGVTLAAGGYVIELADGARDNGLVRVMDAKQSTVYYMGFTRTVQRPEGLPADRWVTFREVPAGIAPPIDAWFPQDESVGHQFVYADR